MPKWDQRFVRTNLSLIGWAIIIWSLQPALPLAATAADSPAERVRNGLVALYDLSAGPKDGIVDRSGSDVALPLNVVDSQAVRFIPDGLEFLSKGTVRTEQPAAKLSERIKRAGALSLEVWVRPANTTQNGPARVATISRDSGERNLTLGQDGDKWEVRLRTTKTSGNGIPSLASPPKSLRADWTHVVYTFSRDGRARLYLDGKQQAEQQIGGEPSNWDDGFRFAVGNELSGDRPWLGTVAIIALFERELTPDEVRRNFQAGRRVAPPSTEELAERELAKHSRNFELRIAPLISTHCLECHDSATRQGGLDLSAKSRAMAGGKGGAVLQPGKSTESRLWQRVAKDEMPRDRTPLSAAEKQLLQSWIDNGAVWSLDRIDPAVYAHGVGENKVFVQRLTVPEYIATVRDTLGVDIAKEARELLPRDLRADGFSNTAYNLTVDLGHVEAYAKLAGIVAERTDIKALAAPYTRSRELSDENVTKVIEPLGRRLLRGSLGPDEVALYCGVSTSVAAAGGNFEEAVAYIVEAMLQAPRFLYRIEQQRGDGNPRPVSPVELAPRLSYILWGAPPDDALLQAADKGQLTREGIAAHAERMLQDRRAIDRSRQFVSEWLNLNRLDNLRPSPERFPNWNPELAQDMKAETLAFFEEVVWTRKQPLSNLLNARVTFVTPRLARHYGLPVRSDMTEGTLARYDLTDVPARGGLLTQGSVLTVGGDDASMVTRGLFVLHELLRGVVRDPPPGIDATPVPSQPGLTQRLIAESRLKNMSCTGCHAKFEPLAFGLEKFDGLGTFHDKDEFDNVLRDDGSILLPGESEPIPYKSSRELMDLLAASPRVQESFTWKVTQFTIGRPLGAEDVPLVTGIHEEARRRGGTYQALMTAIVTSDLVLLSRTEE